MLHMHMNHSGHGRTAAAFISAATLVFFMTLSAADSIGFVPYYVDGTPGRDDIAVADLPTLGEEPASAELPTHLSIPAIDLDLPVQNPTTRDVDALDALLQSGPARYVDSAPLGAPGNMVVFAHSSHLPVVHNQMYKAFNRIPELKAGDTITVSGETGVYLYSVIGVRQANASESVIPLPKEGHILTLVTCDTLTSKDARFILEAELIGKIAE